MTRPLMLLRPQPGNDRSAERARAMGMEAIQFPLFDIVPVAFDKSQDERVDAVLVTSANAVQFGAELLTGLRNKTVYAVGEATASVVRGQGHANVIVGGGEVASTMAIIAAAGHQRILHICGEVSRPFDPLGIEVAKRVVYRSEARDLRPYTKFLSTLPPSVIAVHSPAAGRRLNAIMPPPCRNHFLVTISQAAADGVGNGWRKVHIAARPDDTALLSLARTLCMNA